MNLFSSGPHQTLSRLGEQALLDTIRSWLGPVAPPPPFGMGDDCAVLESGYQRTIVTTDGLVYGHHFDAATPPQLAGAKLIKRNLSDVAAMGGRSRAALCALLLGPNVTLEWLRAFYSGIRECCETYSISIVGGDLSEGPLSSFAAWLTLWGESIPSQPRLLQRRGASLGDHLFITGLLGGSSLGKHLDFTPRLKEGQWLARQTAVRSMIDVTDGLAKDLFPLIPDGCDAMLDCNRIPISEAARYLSQTSGRTALHHALSDGEDYELLFTLAADEDPDAFVALWHRQLTAVPLTCIGRIVTAADPAHSPQMRDVATGQPLAPLGGYAHFSAKTLPPSG